MYKRGSSRESRYGSRGSSHHSQSHRGYQGDYPHRPHGSHNPYSNQSASHLEQESRSTSGSAIPTGPANPSSRTPRHPGSSSNQSNGSSSRRGHFANLSWTPGGGPPPEERSRNNSSSNTPTRPGSHDTDVRARPELRSEVAPNCDSPHSFKKPRLEPSSVVIPVDMDESPINRPFSKKGDAIPEESKSKISFSIKGRTNQLSTAATPSSALDKATPTAPKSEVSPTLAKKTPVVVSPLVQPIPKSKSYVGNVRVTDSVVVKPEPPTTRKEMVRKKRLKPRPTLSEEHAQSDSVYYRKTGNESVVGSGTYGKVYKAIHVYTNRMVALKKIRMEGERDGFPVTATREIKLLQSLNHTNVVALQEVMVEKNDCFMVFEYLAHDLTGLLNHPSFSLTAAHKKHLARQMFEGLDYLHRRGVLHRDIKAANILVSKSGVLKFADFGLARFYQKHQKQDYTNRVITIWYRSPELLLGETQYGPAVDIWSAACVLVEIFTRHAIFPGDGGEINQLEKIYNVLGTPSRNEWPAITELQWYELLRPSPRISSTFAEKYQDRVSSEAFDLLQGMFMYDPSNRPTASDVLEHPYFTTEEPAAQQVVELEQLDGDWHEFESKALRKEKERAERDARRKERDGGEKRKAEDTATAGASSESKRPRTEAAPA